MVHGEMTRKKEIKEYFSEDCFVKNGKQIPLLQMWTLYCCFFMAYVKEIICAVVFVR